MSPDKNTPRFYRSINGGWDYRCFGGWLVCYNRDLFCLWWSKDATPPTKAEKNLKVAELRMDSFVRGFGQTIMGGAPMSLKAFAVSCYIQGCEDMAQVAIREIPPINDFQI